ncbi:hypothetical protein ACFUIW_09090 [Streptomyces sp. NPDC057245]|uniref:hypothetical protein n=1 Tax=Streptomyces sp. NPDC057245 TaxID=3346065 RepID=UPI003640DF2C
MVRDGEEGEPGTAGGDAESREASEPVSHFEVVVSGDGSADIDGERVRVAEGETVDTAILGLLAAYADGRGAPVTATVSDPSAGYVAVVEVSPDGSSRLLEQYESKDPPQKPRSGGTAPPPSPTAAVTADGDGGGDSDGDESDPCAYEDDGDGRRGDGGGVVDADDYDDYDDYDDDDDRDDDRDGDDGHREGDDDDRDGDDDDDDGAPGQLSPIPVGTRSAPVPAAPRGGVPRQSDDEYRTTGMLRKPLVVGPAALVTSALVIVPLIILGSSGDGDQQAGGAVTDASATPAPGEWLTPEPTSPSPSPASPSSTSASPTPTAGKSGAEKPAGAKGARATVTVTAPAPRSTRTVTADAPAETAASAVRRIAKKDPSGQHVCYRAFVAGQGWQLPVCDGTVTGTPGGGKAVKALNIAVYGVGGSDANAFVHSSKPTNGRGEWKPEWTGVVADGKDNYIGSTKGGAPDMIAFAVNVGSGGICQNTYVHEIGWGEKGCAGGRPEMVSGGSFDNDLWLEAVKFTV